MAAWLAQMISLCDSQHNIKSKSRALRSDFFCLYLNILECAILNFEFIFCTFAPENPESVGLRLLLTKKIL